MIKIIVEPVEMPPINERRYQMICKNNKWKVIDKHNTNADRYKGTYENVVLACHNLNKEFYQETAGANVINDLRKTLHDYEVKITGIKGINC